MRVIPEPDFTALRQFWRRDPFRHLYELGDLDPDWRDDCVFYCARSDEEITHAALLYVRPDPPVLLLFAPFASEKDGAFVRALSSQLPDRLSAHTLPGWLDTLSDYTVLESETTIRYGLTAIPDSQPACRTVRLNISDEQEIRSLLEVASPHYYLEPDALRSGVFRGVRDDNGDLIAVGGVHVLSERESVASLGSIAVRGDRRSRGYGRAVTLAVLHALPPSLQWIGLNMTDGNPPAERLYESLGFRKALTFEIAELTR